MSKDYSKKHSAILDSARRIYSEQLSESINHTEAQEIITSLCNYARVLIEIDQEINKSDKSGVMDGL